MKSKSVFRPRLFGWAVAAIAVCVAALPAEGGETQAQVTPGAEKILRQVSEYILRMKSFSVEISTSVKMEAAGMKQEMDVACFVAVQRPNKISIELKKGTPILMGMGMQNRLVSDGVKLYAYSSATKKYTERDAPGELKVGSGSDLPEMAFGAASAIFNPDPYQALLKDVIQVEDLGVASLDGVSCNRLKFKQNEGDAIIWIEAGERALVRKVTMELSKDVLEIGEFITTYENWTVNTDLPQDLFVFTPPEGAQKAESLVPRFEPPPNPLLGKSAPGFQLDLLDGGRLDIEAHKGKNIVILDFWATWCGPCRVAMPQIIQAAEAYKDKGVVLFGVNLKEDTEKIRSFLEKTQLRLNVALDKDGKIGVLYGARAIPQTVIIGKDGTVQVIHVGSLEDLQKKLTEELEALLAGKNLITEAAAKEKK